MAVTGSLLAGVLLTACGSSAENAEPKAVTATATVTATTTVTATPKPSDPPPYPRGFPKRQRVSELPSPINTAFEGQQFAVAIAPGVWTEHAPGTTVREAADFGTFTGYCSSIKAFEKRYTPEPRGNSCW